MNQTGDEKKKKTTKPSTKKTTKTTKSRSKKGGNFLGSVGDLVAPTGWGSFATAAGLLALDGLDSTYRRSSKKEKTGEVKKMKGGLCQQKKTGEIKQITIGSSNGASGMLFNHYNGKNAIFKNKLNSEYYKEFINIYNWKNNKNSQNIIIECNENGKFYFKVNIKCGDDIKTYHHLPPLNTSSKSNDLKYFYDDFEEADRIAKNPDVQVVLIKLALLNKCSKS